MQNHYNLVYREEEREMIPLCREEGIGLIPWSPLARGFLAGNRREEDFGETIRAKTDDFAQICIISRRILRLWTVSARLRASAASPTRRWRWPGCCKSRAWLPRSSARAKCTISTMLWRP